jgi:hypothetical protein
MVRIMTILQRREGEANAQEKWSTLSNLVFIQGRINLHCINLCYSVADIFQSVHINLVYINYILLIDCIVIMLKNIQKIMDMFLARIVHTGRP